MRILDLGSGNTCRNSPDIIFEMIDAIAEVDPKKKFILKWQLFQEAPPNVPLEQASFYMAYNYAEKLGYKTTASVFDIFSLAFLLTFRVPFVKIANRPDLYWLIGEVPRKIKVIASRDTWSTIKEYNWLVYEHLLCCISNYPAYPEEYEKFFAADLQNGISDHTTDWQLFRKYKPQIYECHFCLEHDPDNPDGGLFARTPEQIKEIYEEL